MNNKHKKIKNSQRNLRGKILKAFAGILVSTSFSYAGYSETVDEDGCWDGLNSSGKKCIVVHSATWGNDDKLIVKYRNRCAYRIYVTYSNQRKDGSWDSGATGLRPGSISTWTTYNSTGKYKYNNVGSVKPGSDWVCASRYGLNK